MPKLKEELTSEPTPRSLRKIASVNLHTNAVPYLFGKTENTLSKEKFPGIEISRDENFLFVKLGAREAEIPMGCVKCIYLENE